MELTPYRVERHGIYMTETKRTAAINEQTVCDRKRTLQTGVLTVTLGRLTVTLSELTVTLGKLTMTLSKLTMTLVRRKIPGGLFFCQEVQE